MAQIDRDVEIPQVAPRDAPPDDYQHINASPEAFGAAIGRGAEALGAGAAQAGKFYGQVAADDQTNNLFDLWNKRLRGDPNKQVMGPDGQMMPDLGYLGLRGRNALDARAGVEKAMDDDLKTLRAGLMTDEQRLMFDTQTRRYRQHVGDIVGSHADGAAREWYPQVNNASAKIALDHIANNVDDPEEVAHGAADLVNARVKNVQLAGGGDAQVKEAITQAKREALTAQVMAVAVRDPLRAEQLLEKNRDVAGSAYPQLAEHLRGRADQQRGTIRADADLGLGGGEAVGGVPASFVTAVKRLEGFAPRARWDVKQFTNGYGTKAEADGEVIDPATAHARFVRDFGAATRVVDSVNADLDPGTKAALASLTSNTGADWTKSGLGAAVRAGDLDRAKALFLQYNKVAGQPNAAIAARRSQEAEWFGRTDAGGAVAGLPNKGSVMLRAMEDPDMASRPQMLAAYLARVNHVYEAAHLQNVVDVSGFKTRVQDSTAEALATGTVAQPIAREEFVQKLGESGGGAAWEQYSANLRLGADSRAIASMSPDEIDALRARYVPQPGEGYAAGLKRADELEKAIQRNRVQLSKDPAGFLVANTDGGAAAWKAFNAAIADPHATREGRAMSAQVYAAQMRELQAHAGVAAPHQVILPAGYAQQLAERWKAPQAIPREGAAPGGAAQVLSEINGQSQLWGTSWPKVYSEIAPHLDTTLRVVANGVSPSAGLALINAQQVKEHPLLASLDDASKKTFNSAVTAALNPFFATLGGPLADQVRTDYEGAAKKLTALYMARGGDAADANSAATQAVKDLLEFKYEFRGTLRIPRFDEDEKPAPWTPRDIETGARRVRESLEMLGGVEQLMPPKFVEDGTTHASQAAAAARAVSRDGVWITDPNGERGLTLIYNREPVLRADGSIFMVPWRELSAAVTRLAPKDYSPAEVGGIVP